MITLINKNYRSKVLFTFIYEAYWIISEVKKFTNKFTFLNIFGHVIFGVKNRVEYLHRPYRSKNKRIKKLKFIKP